MLYHPVVESIRKFDLSKLSAPLVVNTDNNCHWKQNIIYSWAKITQKETAFTTNLTNRYFVDALTFIWVQVSLCQD